jgi:hypothetical protein
MRMVFRAECPLATDFVQRHWVEILNAHGFDRFEAHHYYFGHVRLLATYKPDVP